MITIKEFENSIKSLYGKIEEFKKALSSKELEIFTYCLEANYYHKDWIFDEMCEDGMIREDEETLRERIERIKKKRFR
jgi:hypothetical protein